MNGDDLINQARLNQQMQGLSAQGQVAYGGFYHNQTPAKSIMQQLRDKAEELRASLAKVDGWKAELAQCERMIAAAEEPKNG